MSHESKTRVELENCCRLALDKIERNRRMGRILKHVLPASLFLTIFGTRSQPEAVINIGSTDWKVFASALAAVPVIIKRSSGRICTREALKHRNSELGKFWRTMERHFS